MFINLSNHPHFGWQPAQLEAAEHYGEVMDLPFPQIPQDSRSIKLCRDDRPSVE